MTTTLPTQSSASTAQQLAQLYGKRVFAAAYRVLGDASAAEDVQQEVFLRLLQAEPKAVTSWPAYLCTAAVRLALDQVRQRKRWWEWLLRWGEPIPEQAGVEQQSESDERARRLRQALARLPKREAECFSLRYLESMELRAVAQTLGLSENHVNVSLHRARRRLQESMEEPPGPSISSKQHKPSNNKELTS